MSLFFMFTFNQGVSAFDYTVSFTASGASTTIDSVKVQNLTQGTNVTVSAGNTLQLTAVNQVTANDETLRIFPNPILDKATVTYNSSGGGKTSINVFGADGRSLTGIVKNLNIGVNTFQLTLPKGAFAIQFNENGTNHTAKILSQSNHMAGIEFTGIEKVATNAPKKVKTMSIPMHYNYGDLMLYKAYSGNYINIVSDNMTESKTIHFIFVECKDAEGNYYSTVTIGNQIWMAENLKTSKYNDGKSISTVTDNNLWISNSSGAYCWYNNDSITYKNTYGALYNWYAVDTKKLAPIGWHVPGDVEWTALTTHLGGESVAGGRLKEAGTTHWTSHNSSATNETGFNALPGGECYSLNTGMFMDLNNYGYWWSSTKTINYYVWLRNMSNSESKVSRLSPGPVEAFGCSIRCITDSTFILSEDNSMLTFNLSALVGSNGNGEIGVIDDINKTISISGNYASNLASVKLVVLSSYLSTLSIGGIGYHVNAFYNLNTIKTVTVTAQDITKTATYTLNITSQDPVQTFTFAGLTPAPVGVIDKVAKTVSVDVPKGTDVTTLIASWKGSIGMIKVGDTNGVYQTNGTTANDFTTPQTYIFYKGITVGDTYKVTVHVK